jgi:tRNA(Ile)-lysidine synthase TilS/MesJ
MFRGKICLIRPLALVTNRELERYAALRHYRLQNTNCPYADHTRRTQVRQMIGEMIKVNRLARKNLFKSMTNIEPGYLPGWSEEGEH